MATLCVRDVPDYLYEQIRARAKRRGRSIGAEAVALLTEFLRHEEEARRRSLEALRHMDELRRRYVPPPDAVDSVTLLREDRER